MADSERSYPQRQSDSEQVRVRARMAIAKQLFPSPEANLKVNSEFKRLAWAVQGR